MDKIMEARMIELVIFDVCSFKDLVVSSIYCLHDLGLLDLSVSA